jgi:hypothetical protein
VEGGDAGRYSPIMNSGRSGRTVVKPLESSAWRSAGGVPPDNLNYSIKNEKVNTFLKKYFKYLLVFLKMQKNE